MIDSDTWGDTVTSWIATSILKAIERLKIESARIILITTKKTKRGSY